MHRVKHAITRSLYLLGAPFTLQGFKQSIPIQYLVSAMLYAQCVGRHKPQNYLKSCSKKSDNKINTAHLDMGVKDQAAIAGYETKRTDRTMG